MNDEELEQTLRRYRAADAHASLRARVLAPATNRRVPLTRWDWTLACTALGLIVLALGTDPDVSPAAASAAERAWELQVEELAASMGGGDEAVRYATLVLPRPSLAAPALEE